MARYSGIIGFVDTVETSPGIFEKKVVRTQTYSGDVLEIRKRQDSQGSINKELTLDNEISILADEYANDNFFSIAYATYHGVKWTVNSVKVARPRLILSFGGVYNGV
jgi:hypothetical protein